MVIPRRFLDLLGATNLIPGPNSTELNIHIGHRQAGWPGLIVAGSCFIFPAALIALAGALLDGVNAASLSLMVVVPYQLGRTALVDSMTVA